MTKEKELSLTNAKLDPLTGLLLSIKGIRGSFYIQYNHVKNGFQFGITRGVSHSIEDNIKYLNDLQAVLNLLHLDCKLPDINRFKKTDDKYLESYIPDPIMDNETYFNFLAILKLRGLVKGD